MDDLEATFASFFRASSSSSGFSIVSKPALTSEIFELLRPVLLLQRLHEVCQKGDIESVKVQKSKTSLRSDDQRLV